MGCNVVTFKGRAWPGGASWLGVDSGVDDAANSEFRAPHGPSGSTSLYIRALVALYSIIDLRLGRHLIPAEIPDRVLADFSPACYIEAGGPFPPMLIARAGRDTDVINRSIETFVAAAVAAGVDTDYINFAEGQHAFDVRDDNPRSRAIIRHTLDFLSLAPLGERGTV